MNAKKKGKDPKKELKRTAIATLKGGAYSYGIASGGSLLGGMMRNNANQFIQNLSNGSNAYDGCRGWCGKLRSFN
ncbi:hypothetical protein HpMS7_06770 [Helicobacter pylori]